MDNLTILKNEGFLGQRLYRVPPAAVKRMRERPHTKDFLVSDLGYFPVTAGHRVDRPKGTQRNILIFIEEGTGWVHFEGRKFNPTRGQAILLPSGRAHAYGACDNDPWKIYWFHFDGDGAGKLLRWTDFSDEHPVISCPAMDGLRRHFNAVLSLVERGYSDHTLLQLSRSLINVLTLLHAKDPGTERGAASGRIEASMDYMREHLHQAHPLSHYAKMAGFSVSRFSEAFRRHCGVSPMTYLAELRIQRACEMLDNTELRIGEIAEQMGFSDTLYFSRLFRKHAGMPPTAYRKLGIG
jgi:AraC-like DNA-binding protein